MGLLRISDIATLETVLDQVGEGMVACDPEGQFLIWNRGAEEIFGEHQPDLDPALWGEHYGAYCPHRMRLLELHELPLWRAVQALEPVEQALWVVNKQRPQGAWVEVQARPWVSPSGKLLGAIATFRDVTISRWAALTCRLMGALYGSEDYAIVGFDEKGFIVSWNPGAEKLWGYSQREILGQPSMVLMAPGRVGELVLLRHMLEHNLPIPKVETAIMRADGTIVPVARSISPWRGEFEGYAGGVVVLSDVTPRKLVEEKLRRRREQLRELSARLEQVKEEELLRISRELHDELGQQLTGLRLDLAWLDERLADSRPDLGERLAMMARLVDDTLSQVRRMSAQMRPPLLDELGLPSAITHWAEQLEARTTLRVTVELRVNLNNVKSDSSLTIYRILQEASTNVLRHAEATHLWLDASTHNGLLFIGIRDDGRGFDPTPRQRREGLGLLGMRERAHLWGGEVDVESGPGLGTLVRIKLPWSRIAREEVA